MMEHLTPKNIEATIASKEPVLRNLQITQTYSVLNLELSGLLRTDDVTWCGFGAWASKTAGQFIRRDNLDNAIAEFLRDKDWIGEILSSLPGALTWFGWKVKINDAFLIKTLNETALEAARQVAAGNLLVFAELAPLYERFVHTNFNTESFTQAELDALLMYLEETSGRDERREKLKRAFTAYYRAIFEKDAKAKSELILLANLLVGFHEQIRLDPAINSSIHAPVDEIFRKKLLGSLEGWIDASLPGVIFSLLKSYIRREVEPVIDRMAAKWREISTKELMKIEIPTGNLDLSEDIPIRTFSSHGMFPPELATLENLELLDVLRQLDRTPDTTLGSGAGDWGSLDDRMNFICDFFRSAQQDPRLLRAPFTSEQVEALRRGEIPPGKL